MKHFIDGSTIAVDTETTGLDPWHGDEPFAFSFCNEEGRIVYFEWEVDPWTRYVIPNQDEYDQIKALMEDPSITKVFHYAKFDIRMLNAQGIKTKGRIEDTMIMAHCVNTLEPSFGLKQLSEKYLDYPRKDQEDLQTATVRARRYGKKMGWTLGAVYAPDIEGEWKEKSAVAADYWMCRLVNPENNYCEKYCSGDAERTMLLWMFYNQALEDYNVRNIYENEIELFWVVYGMESRGLCVSPDKVEDEIASFQKQILSWLQVLRKDAWSSFNPDSTADVGKLVYKKLKLPVKRRTEKGKPKVDIDALADHLGNPTVNALFKFRACHNGLVNYFYKYRMLRVPEHDCNGDLECWTIHPDLRQCGPATGRFSCRKPNLQNVANALTTRSPMPIQARTPFGPREGYIWYCIDYSQVEVRIFAAVAKEPFMLQALKEGRDIHTECANKAWGGEDNLAAIRSAIHALELDGTGDGKKVQEEWNEYGVSFSNLKDLTEKNRVEIALDWLSKYDFRIVDAENSIDKKTCRAKAKMIVFLKCFGGGARAAADLLFCPVYEAQSFLREYDYTFPRIGVYIAELSEEARHNCYITNLFGRRIAVNPEKAYRSVNYMVQGSAADLLKQAMRNCAQYLKQTALDAHILLCVHDEIIFEFLIKHAYTFVLQELCRIMEDHGGYIPIDTPVGIEKVRDSWNMKVPVDIGDWRVVSA